MAPPPGFRDHRRMLLPAKLWDGIRDGSVTVAFRSWKRPTVKAGGTLQSPVGVLAIEAVDPIDEGDLTEEDARAAGFADRAAALAAQPAAEPGRQLHRVRFHRAGDDPRIALRAAVATGEELVALVAKLDAMDAASATGPWTREVLALIDANPGVRAPDLAAGRDEETTFFKNRVRRLKALGLTESLAVGYRLAPRAHPLLDG